MNHKTLLRIKKKEEKNANLNKVNDYKWAKLGPKLHNVYGEVTEYYKRQTMDGTDSAGDFV